jgi:TPR repeat protein
LLAPVMAGAELATLDLGELYETQPPRPNGDLKQAIAIYRELDANGSAEARRRLARLALDGKGMAKDPQGARRWLLQDAEREDAQSQMALAYGYARGQFGPADVAEALRWTERALATGNKDVREAAASLLYRSVGTPETRRRSFALWEQGDAEDDINIRNDMAWALCTTLVGADFDPARGLAVARRMGAPDALFTAHLDTLAACYAANGDYAQAAVLQQRVIDTVDAQLKQSRAAERERRLAGFRERLALYRSGKPYRDPESIPTSEASNPNNSVSLISSPTK